MGERQAEDIALTQRESAKVGLIDARHGLIPSQQVEARIRDIGRGRTHSIQNALDLEADCCGVGIGIGRLLKPRQEKQMITLYGIQIQDPC